MSNVTYGTVPQNLRRVYFAGTDAILAGYAFFYNHDIGTAADAEISRADTVEKSTATNNLHFAGVSAEAFTGPGWFTIVEPGSFALVYTDVNCTIDTGALTVINTSWLFGSTMIGFDGRGTAIPKQTINRSSTNGTVWAYLQDGPESGTIQEMVSMTGAASTPAAMIGGVQLWNTAKTIAGDTSETVADMVGVNGGRHAVFCGATITTSELIVTVTHHETSDPELFYADGDNEYAYLAWYHDGFYTTALSAPTSTTT
jgi:hypothetical protein